MFINAEIARSLRPPKRSRVENTSYIHDGMAYRGISESDMLALHLQFNQFVTDLSNRTERPMIFGPRLSLSHPSSAFGKMLTSKVKSWFLEFRLSGSEAYCLEGSKLKWEIWSTFVELTCNAFKSEADAWLSGPSNPSEGLQEDYWFSTLVLAEPTWCEQWWAKVDKMIENREFSISVSPAGLEDSIRALWMTLQGGYSKESYHKALMLVSPHHSFSQAISYLISRRNIAKKDITL